MAASSEKGQLCTPHPTQVVKIRDEVEDGPLGRALDLMDNGGRQHIATPEPYSQLLQEMVSYWKMTRSSVGKHPDWGRQEEGKFERWANWGVLGLEGRPLNLEINLPLVQLVHLLVRRLPLGPALPRLGTRRGGE